MLLCYFEILNKVLTFVAFQSIVPHSKGHLLRNKNDETLGKTDGQKETRKTSNAKCGMDRSVERQSNLNFN